MKGMTPEERGAIAAFVAANRRTTPLPQWRLDMAAQIFARALENAASEGSTD